MKRQIWLGLLVSTAIGFAAGVPSVEAESFFKNRSAKPPVAATAQKKKRGLFWFLFENNRKNDGIDTIYGDQPQSKPSGVNVDPEPLPTIGMGNLTYDPPLQVPIYDIALAKLTAPTPDGELIRQALSDKRSRLLATVANRKAILELYKARSFTPVWLKDGKLTDRAFNALAVTAHAGDDGLDPLSYVPVGISSYETATSDAAELDPAAMMRLDISLTSQMLKYAQHLSTGQFVPELLSQYNDINVQTVAPANILRVLAYTPYAEAYFASLAPQHPTYKILKESLAVLNSKAEGEQIVSFPGGPNVKVGQSDERIPTLRERMVEANALDPEFAIVADEDRNLLDKQLAKAIKTFQAQNKAKPTGSLDAKLVNLLNADPTIDQRNKLIVNMERVRWLPKSLGDRYVFVNQAGFFANVFEDGHQVWKTNVIVGKPMTQTPVFHDEYETVVFNPSWGLPQSILINEYLGKLRRNPGYFDKIGYKVTNSDGQVVPSRNIDWYSVSANSGVGVQQPPGKDNALGELKFLFPNKHDVYMHDTPTRKLFGENVRAFSHGCVRVENPREFAHVLLGWDETKIADSIESGESFSVPIPRKTKVHITYFTAWPDETGKVQFYPDIYERDKTMLEALETKSKAQAEMLNKSLADASLVSGSIADP